MREQSKRTKQAAETAAITRLVKFVENPKITAVRGTPEDDAYIPEENEPLYVATKEMGLLNLAQVNSLRAWYGDLTGISTELVEIRALLKVLCMMCKLPDGMYGNYLFLLHQLEDLFRTIEV